ncbi:Phospholipase [Salix suchowensis]|nr:Phospholipase [Salix suchowensis]
MGEEQQGVASSPFDDPDADIILRSSNNVNFHIYSVILKLVSLSFVTCSQFPTHNTNQPNRKTYSTVEEDSTTLDTMLRLCYPGPDPRVTKYAQLTSILRVAEKYDLDGVVEKMGRDYPQVVCMKTALSRLSLWHAVPLERGRNIRSEGIAAYTMDDLLQLASETEALKSVTGMEYHRLFQYHHACRQACQNLTTQVDWMFIWAPIPTLSNDMLTLQRPRGKGAAMNWTKFMLEAPSHREKPARGYQQYQRTSQVSGALSCAPCLKTDLPETAYIHIEDLVEDPCYTSIPQRFSDTRNERRRGGCRLTTPDSASFPFLPTSISKAQSALNESVKLRTFEVPGHSLSTIRPHYCSARLSVFSMSKGDIPKDEASDGRAAGEERDDTQLASASNTIWLS